MCYLAMCRDRLLLLFLRNIPSSNAWISLDLVIGYSVKDSSLVFANCRNPILRNYENIKIKSLRGNTNLGLKIGIRQSLRLEVSVDKSFYHIP